MGRGLEYKGGSQSLREKGNGKGKQKIKAKIEKDLHKNDQRLSFIFEKKRPSIQVVFDQTKGRSRQKGRREKDQRSRKKESKVINEKNQRINGAAKI